jgi:predicted nucleic acid-binding protein
VITYVDSSVLLRIIQGAAGALDAWADLTPVSSELLRVECLRVVDRARARGATDDATAAADRSAVLEALATFSLAPLSDAVLDRAANPFPTALGTLDAIHLATALELQHVYVGLQFATHDEELAVAARAVGFTVRGM